MTMLTISFFLKYYYLQIKSNLIYIKLHRYILGGGDKVKRYIHLIRKKAFYNMDYCPININHIPI